MQRHLYCTWHSNIGLSNGVSLRAGLSVSWPMVDEVGVQETCLKRIRFAIPFPNTSGRNDKFSFNKWPVASKKFPSVNKGPAFQ